MRKLESIIKNNGIAVIKTDTLYGVVGCAKNQSVVNKIYKIKKRDILKPISVIVADIDDIKEFGIEINDDILKITKKYWPGPVSIIIPVPESIDLHYLHKGTGGIAFRIPDDKKLRDFLKKTGPLVAPSANPEGKKAAKNIKEAMAYFGDTVDFYQDSGECTNEQASKIIRITENFDVEILRD